MTMKLKNSIFPILSLILNHIKTKFYLFKKIIKYMIYLLAVSEIRKKFHTTFKEIKCTYGIFIRKFKGHGHTQFNSTACLHSVAT